MENKKNTQGSLANFRIEIKESAPLTEDEERKLKEPRAKKIGAQEVSRKVRERVEKLKDFLAKTPVRYVLLVLILSAWLLYCAVIVPKIVMEPSSTYMFHIKTCVIIAPILFLVLFTVSGGYRLWKELTKIMILVVILLLFLAASQKALEYLPSSEAAKALELMANPSRIWAMIMDFYKSVIVPWVTGA